MTKQWPTSSGLSAYRSRSLRNRLEKANRTLLPILLCASKGTFYGSCVSLRYSRTGLTLCCARIPALRRTIVAFHRDNTRNDHQTGFASKPWLGTHLDAFAQTVDIGPFCVEQFIEDQSRSRRGEMRASKTRSMGLLALFRCFAFAFVQFLLFKFLFETWVTLSAGFFVDLLEKAVKGRDVNALNRQGKPLYDWCSLSFGKSHWSPNPADCTYLWSAERRNANVPPRRPLVRPACAPSSSSPVKNKTGSVFPATQWRRTLSALTKSMYPSSLMSSSSSFDTKHSSCSSIQRKTLSVLRLKELYWRYSSMSFLRCCQALRTVSSLFFKILETSSKKRCMRSVLSPIGWVTFDFLLQRFQIGLGFMEVGSVAESVFVEEIGFLSSNRASLRRSKTCTDRFARALTRRKLCLFSSNCSKRSARIFWISSSVYTFNFSWMSSIVRYSLSNVSNIWET